MKLLTLKATTVFVTVTRFHEVNHRVEDIGVVQNS